MVVCTTESQGDELSVSSRRWSIGLGDASQLEWYLDNRHGIAWAELGSFSRTPGSSEKLERSKNQIHALIVPINDHLPQCREHTTMDQPAYDLGNCFHRKLHM